LTRKKLSVTAKKNLKVGLLTSAGWLCVIGGMLFTYLQEPSRNLLYIDNTTYQQVLIPTKDLQIGDVLDNTNCRIFKIDTKYILSPENLATVENLGEKALIPLVYGEPIYCKDLLNTNNTYAGMIPYPVEIDVFSTIANMVKIGDYVDINAVNADGARMLYNQEGDIVYPSEYYTVIARKRIEDLRTSDGSSIKDKTGVLPSYAIMYFTQNELNKYLDCLNEKFVFLGLYNNSTEETRKEDYPYWSTVFPREEYERTFKKEQGGETE